MRRMLSVAFLSATLSLAPSAFAQRGGGQSPGHPAGGFGGGHIGGSGAHYGSSFGGGSRFAAPGPVFQPHAPNFVSTAPSNAVSTAPIHAFGPAYRQPYIPSGTEWRGGHGGHDRDHDHDRYRSPYRGYGYGGYPYAYANSWQLLPWDLSSSDSIGYGDNTAPGGQQEPAAAEAVPEDGYRPAYEGAAEEQYPYPPAPPADQPMTSPVAPEPALTLVFNDGHQETIHNYVLTQGAIIVLDQAASGRQNRIPLTSIDLAATEQAAQQAGLDFTPPAQ